jgi:hypothetical protein
LDRVIGGGEEEGLRGGVKKCQDFVEEIRNGLDGRESFTKCLRLLTKSASTSLTNGGITYAGRWRRN